MQTDKTFYKYDSNNCIYVPVKTKGDIIISKKDIILSNTFLVIIGILAGIGLNIVFNTFKDVQKHSSTHTYVQIDEKCTFNNVFEYSKKIGIQHPLVFMAICQTETGLGTNREEEPNNKYHISKNNPICMSRSDRAFSTNPKNERFASFNSYKDCCLDFLMLQYKYAWNLNEEQFINWLATNYCPDKGYKQTIIEKVYKLKKQYENTK